MNTEILLQSLKRHEGELFGRQDEVDRLQSLLMEQDRSCCTSRAIFVHGYSGSGKSKLVHHFFSSKKSKHKRKQQRDWLFAEGKFDQQRSNHPYSALVDACRSLCRQFLLTVDAQTSLTANGSESESKNETEQQICDSKEAEPTRELPQGEAALNQDERTVCPHDINIMTTNSQRQKPVEYLERLLAKDYPLLVHVIPELEQLLPELHQKHQQFSDPNPVDDTSINTDKEGAHNIEKNNNYDSCSSLAVHCEESNSDGTGNSCQFDQLKVAFQNLFAGLIHFVPIVLFLDDLQWSDAATIDILFALLSKDENASLTSFASNKLVFVGAYRDNELVGEHPLVKPVSLLEALPCASKVHVSDLTLNSLNSFIAAILKYEDAPETTMDLTRLVHQRTRGNIFFVLQFLQMLVTTDDTSLYYDFLETRWKWDTSKLQEQTHATENVTDLVIRRMRKLPEDTALALIIASHLGHRFEARVVRCILNQWRNGNIRDNDNDQGNQYNADRVSQNLEQNHQSFHISQMSFDSNPNEIEDLIEGNLDFLEIPLQEGFIVLVDSSISDSSQQSDNDQAMGVWYRFLHDRIQQAAMELISDETQRKALRLRTGTLLFEMNTKSCQQTGKPLTWAILSAVDLLNSATDLIHDDSRKLDLALANKEAAQIAASQSAFSAAVTYMQQSRAMLLSVGASCDDASSDINDSATEHTIRMWKEQYEVALDIFTLSANMEFCCGKYVECQMLFNQVRAHARKPQDSLLISYIMMKALGAQAKFDESIDLGYEVLNENGFYMPRRGASSQDVKTAFRKVVDRLDKISDKEVLKVPDQPLDNATRVFCRMFSSLVLFTWHANRYLDHSFVASSFAMVTLDKGISEYAGQSFSLFAIDCIVKNHMSLVKRLYNLTAGPSLENLYTGKEIEAGTLCACYAPSGHIFCPLPVIAEKYMKGYESGMNCGAVEWAMANAGCYLLTHFLSGLSLDVFETESLVFIQEMYKYKSNIHRPVCEMYLQVAMNLMGKNFSGPVTKLEGAATQNYCMPQIMDGTQSDFPCHAAWFAQLMLAYYFGDYDTAAEMAVKHEDSHALDRPMFWSIPHPFFRGLAYAAKVRSLQRRKQGSTRGWFGKRKEAKFYTKRMQKQLEILKSDAESGFINSVHMYEILLGEVESVKSKADYDLVINAYTKGIRSAMRSGFRHDAALATERRAAFMLERGNVDSFEIKCQIQAAIKLYREWGATAKADALQRRYANMMLGSVDSTPGSTIIISKSFRASVSVRDKRERRVSVTTKKLNSLDFSEDEQKSNSIQRAITR